MSVNDSKQPPCVLLVEDSPDDIFFFKRALEKMGIDAALQIADDGAKAIEYLSTGATMVPDIMFLDLKMPNVNGFEVLEWLETQNFKTRIRVVVLTSSEEPREMHAAYGLGAAAFITKPVSSERLRQEIESAQTDQASRTSRALDASHAGQHRAAHEG